MINRKQSATDNRKQAVSIRMSRSDVRHIKRLAERLGVRDSDVVRFAIKLMLAKLSPLHDQAVRGRGLVPVLMESGADLMRHFDLDALRLGGIVNEGAEQDKRVDPDDIQLIAMTGVQRSYVKMRVAGLRRASGIGPVANAQLGAGDGNGAPAAGADERRELASSDSLDQELRQYLFDKYLYVKSGDPTSGLGGGR